MKTIQLTDEEYAVLCGLVQPTDQVDSSGIYTEVWESLRDKFPLSEFQAYAQAKPDFNEPED